MTPTGLAAEIWWFQAGDGEGRAGGDAGPSVKAADAFSLLRPEAAEALFYLDRATGDPRWRDAGWRVFQAIEAHARVPTGGYAAVEDVRAANPGRVKLRDKMESFFLSETLKYLYLLFGGEGGGERSSTLLPLDDVVFNTEAHPFPVFEWP